MPFFYAPFLRFSFVISPCRGVVDIIVKPALTFVGRCAFVDVFAKFYQSIIIVVAYSERVFEADACVFCFFVRLFVKVNKNLTKFGVCRVFIRFLAFKRSCNRFFYSL